MKKVTFNHMGTLFQLLYTSLPGAGTFIALDCFFDFPLNRPLGIILIFLFQSFFLLFKKNTWFALSLGILIIHGALFYLFYKIKMPDTFISILLLELTCISLTLFCIYISTRFLLKLLIFIGLLSSLIFFSLYQIPQEKWEVCLTLLYFLLFLAETAENRYIRGTKKISSNTLYLFPLFLVALVLLFFLPTKTTPIRWEYLRALGNAVKEKAIDIASSIEYYITGKDSGFSLSFTGYTTENSLGGTLLSNDSLQLSVKGIQTKSPLYLAGSTYSEYTGKNWIKNEDDETSWEKEYKRSYKDIQFALQESLSTQEEVSAFCNYGSLQIYYEGIKTDSLFIAPITGNINLPSNKSLAAKQKNGLTLKRPEKKGFNYNISFLELDYSNENLQDLLNNPPPADSTSQKRIQNIYHIYTQLPDSLPTRVKELSHSVTAGADTDYEKLKAIEVYLKNYSYTKTPPPPPANQDFIDYFLFEENSGYCTYFATAMAVMARCEGIPTRYVEGFVTPKTMKKNNTPIRITGYNAHAWPEAYISGFGWVAFEPTPGYNTSDGLGWEIKDMNPKTDYNLVSQEKPDTNISDTTEIPTFQDTGGSTWNIKSIVVIVLKILMVLFLILLFFILILVTRNIVRKINYHKKSPYQKILYLMKEILSIGELCHLKLQKGEPLTHYSKRITQTLDTQTYSFIQIVKTFEEIRYGGKEVNSDALHMMEHYFKMLKEQQFEHERFKKIRRLLLG